MAKDFIAKVTAELDTAEAEGKLNAFLNQNNKLKIDVELNQDSAKKLSSSIEKGIKQTKIDTSCISKQLAESFNITDKSTINQIRSQLNKMMTSLGKAWDGSNFNVKDSGFSDFAAGMEPLQKTLSENAKLVQGATGIYDDFFNYFKDKKIFVSDALKKELGEDNYKELLQNNVGKIVRDASKGVSIDSIWGEMKTLFPEHFAENITTQADQIIHAFDLMKKARADMTQVISAQDMDAQTRADVDEFAWKQTSDASNMIMQSLQKNIQSAQEAAKTTIDLDVDVNADKITSDIREAVQNAGNGTGDAMNVDLKVNDEQLTSNLREAIAKIATGDEPVKVDLQVNKESLQSDLNLALADLDLPVHFKIDADAIAAELKEAVNKITDIKIDLHVNTDSLNAEINNATDNNSGASSDTTRMTALQQMLGNINAAGAAGQSTFQRFGGSLKEAFSTYTMANMLQDGIYKVVDAGKQGLETVKEFNDIKTDLAMATGESKTYINDLMQSYNELGQELGSVTSDVAQSADSWLRQGRTMSETNQLIKDSMVLSKDAQMSSEQSSEVLTATLNGFQMNADQAGHINDVLTSIDLESASDAGGIGQALTKVASQANNAGVSLEKTAAMIATIKDVTQDSDETIGTALKSIFSRMNQIKAGKFVDSETGEALNDVEKVLNKVGISMRDVNGQFKDSEPVIDAVAEKWSSFDGNTKKAIATAMAGTHQYNKLIAMMDNWNKVQALTETAQNSDGTAEKKFNDNYMNSLEAKTNALKASLENVATSVVSDDMYAGFLDGAKAVADFTAQTDLLKASLVGLGAAGGVYAFGWIQNLIQDFSNLGKAMDILKAGNLTDAGFENLLNLTQGLSASQAKLLASSTALSEAQRVLLLMNTGMSEAEAQAAVAAMGLSAANGTAAASTVTLSGALSGLWATLMANPLILVAAGVTAAVAAISSYNNSVKEAVSSARESGNAWEENNTSIEDNISRIQELRTELASGTLTEQEAADAKSELLSIQESLTDSYGDQVQGIDLINGSLEQQIELLDKVSQKESENFLNENKKGIDKATKEMEKNRHNYLGQFYDNGSDESEALKTSIQKLQKTYGDEVVKLEKGSDGITMNVAIDADATTAKDALNDFMTEVSDIEKQYGESDTLELLSDNAAAGLTDTKDVLEEYQSLYEQAQKAEMKSDKTLFSADGKEQTAAKWLSDYAKAVQEYNDAVADGDDTKIKEAATSFNTLDSTMQELSKGSMSEYADQVQEVRDQLNETAIANDKFTKAVKGSDSSDFGKTVSESAKALKDLNLTDTDFKYAFETEGIQEGEDAVNSLVDAAVQCGVISDSSSEQVNNLVNMLVQLGVISSSTGAGLDTAADSASGLATQIENVNTALSGIEKANSLLNSQSTGQSISIDDFNSDELADYTSALEYNNGALQLNAEKVRELQKAKAEEAIQTNDNQKLEKQNQYMENIAQIEQLQEELRNLSDAKSDNAQSIQDNIDALLSENDSIVNQCNQLDLLSASLREATGAYQNWLDKQNASESGDMFDDAMGALQHIEDTTQNTDSEYYGRTGREDYKAAVDFIVPDTIDHDDEAAVSSYIDSIEHYFNHDSEGNRTGLDVAEFCAKATKAGLMELDEASGEYKIAGQRTMQDFVDGLNLSMPMVQAMFGEMEEFGGQFDWADESIKTLGDLGMAAGEAKSRIEEMSGDTGMNIQIDVSDIENTEDKITTLDNTIQQMQDYKGTVEVDSSQVDDANAVIQYCVTQKQMLEQPAVMSVDASQVDGEIGNALSLLQQFQQAQNNVELQAAVGADTSEAQGQVDSLVSEIQGLSPEIQAKLNIDTTSADTITASLQGLTPEIMVQAGVDSSLVDAWASEEKKSEGKVNWTNETGAVDAWAAQMHTSNGQVTWTNDVSQVKTSFTATGTVHWTNTTPPSGGTHRVNGTAHAAGTAHYNHLVGHAYAEGNWGTKTGGTTLVGELGRELVVDPGSGTWHTVGDNGAEFTDIPAGSIVFNHKQTEALLERGFVAGRGTTRANGTAMVRGGISVKQANIASGKTTYSGSSGSDKTSKSVEKAAKETSKAAGKVSKWTDPWKNVKDWFERVVNRLQNLIDLNKAKADNVYQISKKNKYTQDSIDNTERLLGNYKKAERMYTKKSNQYAKKIGLSSKLKKRVQNGTVNIESLSETDKQKVEAYQKWYDKINECRKAIEELKAKEKELYQQKLDNITDRYDALKNVYSTQNDTLDSLNSWRETAGASQAVDSDYYKAIQQQISNQNKYSDLLQKQITEYQKEYDRMVKKYGADDTDVKKAAATLQELKGALYDSKKSVAENTNKLNDLRLSMAKYETERFENASDKMSAYRDYKENNHYKGTTGITETDYLEGIKANDSTILSLQEQKDIITGLMAKESKDSPQYREYAKDLADLDKRIFQTADSTAELKKSMVELRFKPFEDAQEELDNYIDDLGNLRDMMDSDSFLNDDGSYTEQGLSNILLLGKEVDAYKQKIADYEEQLKKIQELYDNGMLTVEEYKDYTKDAMDKINSASKSMYSSQQSLLQAYEDQITKVNDALQDNIDKRKKARQAKEDYYDYDKTLKDKNKDINALRAQIAALEGTTNAAAKARLAQLKADLKDKEDDLADTKYKHQLDLENDGYDELSDQANDALDKTLQNVKSNSELQKSIINDMLKEVQGSYQTTADAVKKIIEDTGYHTSKVFDDLIGKAELTNKTVKEVTAGKTATDINTDGVDSGDARPDKSKADRVIEKTVSESDTLKNAAAFQPSKNPTVETIEQRQAREQAEAAAAAAQKAKAAVESAANTKAKLQEWYNSVPTGKVANSKFKEKHHDFYYYFWKKNKKVGQKDFEQVAKILGHNYIASKPYKDWKPEWRDKIFKELKGYGFSKGGVVRNLIPADAMSFLGDAILKNGDTGFVPINRGETILTQEFTKQLKPATAIMSQFNDMLSGKLSNIPASNQENTFNSNVTINVDTISSDVDVKKLAKEVSNTVMNDYSKYMRKDMMKLTGRNR